MGRLEGYTALVTGGGSGVGRAVVERFVSEGARVGVLEIVPEKVAKLAIEFGDAVVAIEGDASRWTDNQRAVAETVAAFGQLDTFVANAGLWDYGTALVALPEDAIEEAFDQLFALNVKGYLLGARAAVAELVKTRGSMIFTGSPASFDPGGGGPLYTASKHAVRGLVTELAYELAPKVRVNGVAPGGIGSDLRGPRALGQDQMSVSTLEGFADFVKQITPLAFMPAAEDYASLYVLLASREESKTMTGTLVRADQGIGVRGLGQVAGGADL